MVCFCGVELFLKWRLNKYMLKSFVSFFAFWMEIRDLYSAGMSEHCNTYRVEF